MSSCFISDLHLDDAREDIKKTFFKFLDDEAPKFDNLYILGDLFEVWIGDDCQDTLSVEVIKRLKAFSHAGKKIYLPSINEIRNLVLNRSNSKKVNENEEFNKNNIFFFGS